MPYAKDPPNINGLRRPSMPSRPFSGQVVSDIHLQGNAQRLQSGNVPLLKAEKRCYKASSCIDALLNKITPTLRRWLRPSQSWKGCHTPSADLHAQGQYLALENRAIKLQTFLSCEPRSRDKNNGMADRRQHRLATIFHRTKALELWRHEADLLGACGPVRTSNERAKAVKNDKNACVSTFASERTLQRQDVKGKPCAIRHPHFMAHFQQAICKDPQPVDCVCGL
jgi:hypothetical protein